MPSTIKSPCLLYHGESSSACNHDVQQADMLGCRRNGKPTSLGCFDLETEAAKAYDKMMLWCELHQNLGMKGGITNFDASEYERDLEHLQNISQVRL